MHLHPIDIGGIRTENNVFLAPLAGYTNYPFRKICLESGAGLICTEMVSAKGLHFGSENTRELLYTDAAEKIKTAQLFGNDPAILREACESEALAPFQIVDINMGCPMPKIYNNGEGSALLADPVLAAKIVSECKKSGKRITVKMRIGLTGENIVAADFAKRLLDAGADMLSVHGRTRDKIYAGEPDYAAVASVVRAAEGRIPVIANGGIFSTDDADRMLENTGADGVMLARAAMYDPQIFCDFTGRARRSKKEIVLTQLKETLELFGERFATVYMRKMAAFYLRGEQGAAAARERLFSCPDTAAVAAAVREIFP